tara:strand:- start:68 stop:505 length:438 start_codon:yes stop_codon:yes gene_type:complete
MSHFLDYLKEGLLHADGMREDLQSHVRVVANQWLESGVFVEKVERVAEYFAYIAKQMNEENLPKEVLLEEQEGLYACEELRELLERGLPLEIAADDLVVLALHLMDIVEHMSLKIYLPVLPDMVARSERSAKAARSVGLAQHLRG